MARNRLILCLSAIMFVVSVGLAQTRVGVRLVVPPNGEFAMEDMWALWLNATGGPATVYLYGYIEVNADRVVECTTSNALHLDNGQHRVTAQDIHGVRGVKYNQAYRAFVQQGGQLPEGDYTFCVEVYDSATTRQLGRQCRTVRVRHPSPPRLIRPLNGVTLTTPLPEFVYTAPMPKPSGPLTYELRVYEVKEGQTSIEAAAANPPWVDEKGIVATSFQYKTSARPLGQGMTFAWYVTAGMLKSQVFSFTVKGGVIPPTPSPISPPTPPSVTGAIRLITPVGKVKKWSGLKFAWRLVGPAGRIKDVEYDLEVMQIPSDTAETARAVLRQEGIRGNTFPVPPLDTTATYMWRVRGHGPGGWFLDGPPGGFGPAEPMPLPCMCAPQHKWPGPEIPKVCVGDNVTLCADFWFPSGTKTWKLLDPNGVEVPGQSGTTTSGHICATILVPLNAPPGLNKYRIYAEKSIDCKATCGSPVWVYPKATIDLPEVCVGTVARCEIPNAEQAGFVIDHWDCSDFVNGNWTTPKFAQYGNPGNTIAADPDCSNNLTSFVTRRYSPVYSSTSPTLPTPWPTGCDQYVYQTIWCPSLMGTVTVSPNQYCRTASYGVSAVCNVTGARGTITWSYSGPTGAVASFQDVNAASTTFIVDAASPAGDYTVTVTVKNGLCPAAWQSASFKVQDQIDFKLTSSKTEICPNDAAELDVVVNSGTWLSGTQVTWYYQSDPAGNQCNPSGTWTQFGGTTKHQNTNHIGNMGTYSPNPEKYICYRVVVNQPPGSVCPNPPEVTVGIKIIQPPCVPTVSLLSGTLPKCQGKTVTLLAATSCGDGPFTWKWLLDGEQVFPSSGTTTSPVYADVTTPGNYEVWVFNKNGCDSAKSAVFKVTDCGFDGYIDGPCASDGVTPITLTVVGNVGPNPPCGGSHACHWLTGENTCSITVTPTATTTYSVEVTMLSVPYCKTILTKTIKVCP